MLEPFIAPTVAKLYLTLAAAIVVKMFCYLIESCIKVVLISEKYYGRTKFANNPQSNRLYTESQNKVSQVVSPLRKFRKIST